MYKFLQNLWINGSVFDQIIMSIISTFIMSIILFLVILMPRVFGVLALALIAVGLNGMMLFIIFNRDECDR